MDISTNQKPTIYRNLYENTGPAPDTIMYIFLLYKSTNSYTTQVGNTHPNRYTTTASITMHQPEQAMGYLR